MGGKILDFRGDILTVCSVCTGYTIVILSDSPAPRRRCPDAQVDYTACLPSRLACGLHEMGLELPEEIRKLTLHSSLKRSQWPSVPDADQWILCLLYTSPSPRD